MVVDPAVPTSQWYSPPLAEERGIRLTSLEPVPRPVARPGSNRRRPAGLGMLGPQSGPVPLGAYIENARGTAGQDGQGGHVPDNGTRSGQVLPSMAIGSRLMTPPDTKNPF